MSYRETIAAVLAMLSEVYQGKFTVSAYTLTVWSDMLEDLSPAEIDAAARAWCSTQKWPPTIADIRGAVPRLCRCGKCLACYRRSHARATALCNAGSNGVEDFNQPMLVSDIARERLERVATARQIAAGAAGKRLTP